MKQHPNNKIYIMALERNITQPKPGDIVYARQEFRKTLESIHIDAIRTQKSYECLEKELKKYE